MIARVALLVTLVLALGHAFADEHEKAEPAKAEKAQAEERVCFNRRTVDTFEGLSDKHVFIEERGKDYYLLTMRNRCSGLEDARGIGIVHHRAGAPELGREKRAGLEAGLGGLQGAGRRHGASLQRLDPADAGLHAAVGITHLARYRPSLLLQ